MVTYTIYMKGLSTGTGWQDVTHAVILDKGLSLRKGFGSLSDAIDVGSVSLTVRMESLREAALLHVNQKQVLIQKNGVTIFEGVSFDDADVDLDMNTDYVYASLKFKPYSSAFEKSKVPEDTVLTDVKVCDPTDTENSLVHILFGMIIDNLPGVLSDIVSASYSISTTISNTRVLELVILEKGESIEDYLTDVLYQNGYTYYMDLFSIVVIEPYQDGRVVTQGLQITEILAKPKISQAPYITDKKCVVRFPKVEQYANETVYELNADRYDDSGEPTQVDVIEPGAFYPLDSDGEPITMEADYGTERETDDIELVHTVGRTLSYVVKTWVNPEDPDQGTHPASVVVDEKELGVLSATFKLYNNNSYQVSLRDVMVKATTAYYRNWIAKYDDPSVVSSDLDEIDGVYMPDADTAKAFVKRYGAETRAQRTQVTFQTHLVLAPNSLIEIAGLPYQLLVRYRTEANDGTGYIEYDCVAYLVEDVTVGGKVAVVPKRTPRDGSSPIPVRLYAIGDDSAPFEDSERVADDTYVLADDYGAVGIDNAWGEIRPTPSEGQYVWYKIGYYTPPAKWPITWTVPVRDEGLTAYALQISAPEGTTIRMSGRGVLRTASLKFTAILSNILPASVVWAASNGTLNLVAGDDYSRTLDCSTVSADSVTITITATIGVHTYSASIGVQRVFGTIVPANLHTVTELPTSVGGEPLANGDYFLAGATFTEGATTYTKGEIWEYQNGSWALSTDQSKAMSLLGDFADLEVDVDSTVIGNAVIKKLIALDAVIKTLLAQNITAGSGDGTASSGFRFRAMSDVNHAGGDNPVFDVFKDDKQLFKADIETGKIFFGEHFWYDPSDGAIHTTGDKTVIRPDGKIEAEGGDFSGTVNASSGVFRGSIDSPAFSSLPSSGGTTDDTSLTSNEKYQVNTMCDYCVATLTIDHFYSCSVSIDSAVAYIRWGGSSNITDVYFYNSSFVRVAEMRRNYGTFGWTYHSTYAGSALTVSVSYGAGDVFKFKAIPTSATGLASGQVWSDSGTLKVKL